MHISVHTNQNRYNNHCTRINDSILKDHILTFSARGLLALILSLRKESPTSFSDLYLTARTNEDKQELIRGFKRLVMMGYLYSGALDDFIEKSGPLGMSRYAPLVKFLTENARNPNYQWREGR